MNENLEKLIAIKYSDKYKHLRKKLIIEILEDFEKRLKTIEAELGIYTEEEILERFTMKVKEIKIGGTDPD